LKHIPEHGFSVRSLQKAASSLPAFQNLAATPLGIEQLFPSPPPRSTPSLLAASSSLLKGKAPEAPIETERLGPVRALFEAWTEDRRETLQSLAKDIKKGHEGVRQALEMRLEDNLPVLPFLPEVRCFDTEGQQKI
jgi:ubiquinone biosynthesis protein COQ9